MSPFSTFLSLLLRFEASILVEQYDSFQAAFDAHRFNALVNDPDDRGGATFCGITLDTYRLYLCGFYGRTDTDAVGADDLRELTYYDWQNIVRRHYWAPLHCDEMRSPGVAVCVADFAFNSGPARAVRALQSALNEVAVRAGSHLQPLLLDGVVGTLTLDCMRRLLTTSIRARQVSDLVTQARLALIDGGIANGRIHPKYRTGLTRRARYVHLISESL